MYKASVYVNKKNIKISGEKLLTIGIITKNDSKRLERCLKSLIPIREALDCEIIVTDTGSTDNTIEIAEKHSDKVIHFKWCDDFAAARNTGIDEGKGLWFMWIDSDEWIENPQPLIDFFNKGMHDSHASANVSFIDIHDSNRAIKSSHTLFRLCLLYDGIRFKDNVHEHIERTLPCYNIKTNIYHDGYLFDNIEEKQKKHDRNIELLLKLHNNDLENIATIRYMVDQYRFINDYEDSTRYCEKGIIAIKNKKSEKHSDKAHLMNFIILKASNYHEMGMYSEAIETLSNIEDNDKKLSFRFIDIYFLLFESYKRKRKWDEAFIYCEKYLDYFSMKGEFDDSYSTSFLLKYDRQDTVKLALDYYINNIEKTSYNEDFEHRLLRYINKFSEAEAEFDENEGVGEYLSYVFKLISIFNSYGLVKYLFQQVADNKLNISKKTLEKAVSDYIYFNKNAASNILKELAELESESEIVRLSQIMQMDAVKDREKMQFLIIRMLKDNINNDGVKSELIYLALKSGLDFRVLRGHIDLFSSGAYVRSLYIQHGDYCNRIIEYYNEYNADNKTVEFYYFIAILLESAMNYKTDESTLNSIYKINCEIIPELINSIYDKRIMKENNIDMYPPLFRFGYFIDNADKCESEGDISGYIRELNKAVNHYPLMKEPIRAEAENLEKQIEEKNRQLSEFDQLASGVKQKIYELITSGKDEEALSIISQLRKILPDDRELKELNSRLRNL